MIDFFIKHEQPVFRPPREHDSLILQVTIGCSRNSCAFCAMYKSKKFRFKSVEEIEGEISRIPGPLRSGVTKVFLADGDAFCLEPAALFKISETLFKNFENLRHISAYANALDITSKTPAELKKLRAAGYKNLYIGLESGSDAVLQLMGKKGSFEAAKLAMNMAHDAGFVLSVTLLLGIGGKRYTKMHSYESANLINACAPRFVNTLTVTLYDSAPLASIVKKGGFDMLSNVEIVDEHYDFINNLSVNRVIYRSNHVSNFINLEGTLSKDKQKLLDALSSFGGSINDNSFLKLKTGGNYEN